MNRMLRNRLNSAAKTGFAFVMGAFAILTFKYWGLIVAIPLLLWLLLPLLIQRGAFDGYYRGQNLIGERKYNDAVEVLTDFYETLDKEPKRLRAERFIPAPTSKNIRALTLNALGAAYLMLGQLSDAEICFVNSIMQDEGFPLPYINMALLCYACGKNTEGNGYEKQAIQLGADKKSMANMSGQVEYLKKRVQQRRKKQQH